MIDICSQGYYNAISINQEDYNMNIGYKRVSTKDQVTDRQLLDIPLDRVYEESVSGATRDRPRLIACLDALREGDTLHVHSVDRLARSLIDALSIIEQVIQAGAKIIFYAEKLEFSSDKANPYHTFVLQIFASIAQLERSMGKQRQREGIDRAKERGTRSGKPFGNQPLDMSLRPRAIELSMQGLNISQIARAMKLSRPSISKLLS
jgi:DNA invertase Pin-like site-specific DNA recombinase